MSLFCLGGLAQEVIIDEHFDAFTEGSEQEPATTDISGYSGKLKKTIDWNGKYVYEAGGMLKVSDGGNLRTSSFSKITAATNIKLTFRVKCIDSYGGAVSVKQGYTPAGTFVFEDNEWHTITTVIANVRSTGYVQFEPYLSASGLLIDDVKVEASDAFLPKPEAYQPVVATKDRFNAFWKSVSGVDSYLLDVYTKTADGNEYFLKDFEVTGTRYSVEGLDESKTYYYTVRAKKGENISDYSNEIEVVEVIYSVDTPVALPATNVGSDGFDANWEKVDDATKYSVLLTRTDIMDEDKTVNIIEDDFSKVTEGTLEYASFPTTSATLDRYTKNPGWTSYMPCLAKGYMGLYPISPESGSFIKTPSLNLSHSEGKFRVTLNMAEINYGTPVEGGNVEIRVYNGTAEEPVTTQNVTLESGFKDYVLDFEGGTSDTYVEVFYNGKHKLFIDSTAISQDLKKDESFSTLIETRELDDVSTCRFDVPLSDKVTYSYQVIAYVRTVIDSEIGYRSSEPSNVISVEYKQPTSIETAANGDGMTVRAVDGGIIVNLDKDIKVNIYNVAGQLVASADGKKGTNLINVASGLVIVKSGNKSMKVAVK